MDAASSAQLGELDGVPAAIGGHRVDRRSQAGGLASRTSTAIFPTSASRKSGELDRPTAVDHEMLVGIRDAKLGGRDVTEDGPGEAHPGCPTPGSASPRRPRRRPGTAASRLVDGGCDRRPAAVDGEELTGHGPRLVGQQEDGRRGNVVRVERTR